MRPPDPEWQRFAQEPFARWVPESDLKYRAHAIRSLIEQRAKIPAETPIELEIGSNRGRFIKGLCAGRPEVHFVGIEIKRNLCTTAAKRLKRHDLDNGQFFPADARQAVPILFGEERLQAVYVLFPDPWWKKRHAKRRILNSDFLELLHAHLIEGGHLIVKTDVPFYAQHVRQLLSAIPQMFKAVEVEEVPGADRWAMTTRERHCEEDGIPINHLFVRKLACDQATRTEAMKAARAVEAAADDSLT